MGTPQYTDPWPVELGKLRQLIHAAMTAAWSRIAFMRLVAAELLVGAVTGRRIVINPADADLPEIRFYTDAETHASIVAGGDEGSGIEILGLAGAQGQRYALRVGESGVRVLYADAQGVDDIGGRITLNTSGAAVGFWGDGSDSESFIQFESDGVIHPIGRWDSNSAGSYWANLVGALTVGSGFVGVNVSYGSTLATDVIPVATVHDLTISGNPGFSWCMTARSSSGFSIDWSSSSTTNKEITYWAARA